MKNSFKVLFIILVLSFLSGCTIQYNLEFVDSSLKESINVSLKDNNYDSSKIDSLKAIKLFAISKGLEQVEYDKKFKDNGKEFTANYKFTYSIDDFYKNNILNQCYDSFSLIESSDYYLLSTGKTFNCLSIDFTVVDSYEINIKTNHKVLEHNADEEKKGIYTWRIVNSGEDVYAEKPIMIKFSKETNKSILDDNTVAILLVLLAITLIGGIIFLVAYYKNKTNNKI